MKTFARRFFELCLLVGLFCGTGVLCYESGRREVLPAPPAAVQPVEPPAPVLEEKKPEITDEQPAKQTTSLPQIVIRGTPFLVSAQRFTGPSLPVQETVAQEPPAEDVAVAIRPKPECGPEPDKLEPTPATQPLPPAQQQQVEYQCNCRRCRRMYGW